MKEFLNPAGLCAFKGMSHVCRATGTTIYISGQVPVNEKGELVGKSDSKQQAEQVFENLGRALKAVGAEVQDIVKLNTYLVNSRDRTPTKEVRKKFLGEHCPTTTSYTVKCLASPDFLIEVEAIAVLCAQ